MTRRVARLNSLLREVLSEVLSRDIHHHAHVTITSVDITSDLSYAKVLFTMMGTKEEKESVARDLNTLAPKIRAIALRKVSMRTFPHVHFSFDEGLEHQLHINDLLAKVAPKD